jgi:uncharacterized protein (TIGR02996 family)
MRVLNGRPLDIMNLGLRFLVEVTMDERGFLKAIEENPDDTVTRLAYADWLEEQGRSYEAMKQRVKGGVSQVQYKLRRKSDGLFSEGGGGAQVQWTTKGKIWPGLAHIRGHLIAQGRRERYGNNTSWSSLEVVVFELRVLPQGTLPISIEKHEQYSWKRIITIEEPQGPRYDSSQAE